MKKFTIALIFVFLGSEAGLSQQKKQQLRDQPKAAQPGRRANAQPRGAALQDLVISFYVTQFRQITEVSDEVFVKALPFLEQFVQDRFEITQRRRRTFNQLRMSLDSVGADDVVGRLTRELDSADAEVLSNQENFMRNVDPLLNTRQQGRLRIFLELTDQRIRQMINGIQNPAANQPAR